MKLAILRHGEYFAAINIYEDKAPRDLDLDKNAKVVLDEAKENYPELNKDCSIEKIKLDGEDARVVKHRDHGAHWISYCAIHDGQLYDIDCMARDSALDEMQKQIKDVMDTFAWVKKK